ncbi:MAG: methyltransferase [Thermodesulfobacteriota bacterium]
MPGRPSPCPADRLDAEGISADRLFGGQLICRQPRRGYRFSVDAVLLAHFCQPRRRDRILDLGAGCGVVSLILARRWPEVQLLALELQPELADLAAANAAANGFALRLAVRCGDLAAIRQLVPAGAFDLVVTNPPYRRLGSGRRNPVPGQETARHETEASLAAVLTAGRHALRTRGRLALIYPAERLAGLLAGLVAQRLAPKRLRTVHSHPGGEGRLVLVEAVKEGGEGLRVLPPLVIRDRPGGAYSPEVAACYASGPGLSLPDPRPSS